jgi:hypothetical protein
VTQLKLSPNEFLAEICRWKSIKKLSPAGLQPTGLRKLASVTREFVSWYQKTVRRVAHRSLRNRRIHDRKSLRLHFVLRQRVSGLSRVTVSGREDVLAKRKPAGNLGSTLALVTGPIRRALIQSRSDDGSSDGQFRNLASPQGPCQGS